MSGLSAFSPCFKSRWTDIRRRIKKKGNEVTLPAAECCETFFSYFPLLVSVLIHVFISSLCLEENDPLFLEEYWRKSAAAGKGLEKCFGAVSFFIQVRRVCEKQMDRNTTGENLFKTFCAYTFELFCNYFHDTPVFSTKKYSRKKSNIALHRFPARDAWMKSACNTWTETILGGHKRQLPFPLSASPTARVVSQRRVLMSKSTCSFRTSSWIVWTTAVKHAEYVSLKHLCNTLASTLTSTARNTWTSSFLETNGIF